MKIHVIILANVYLYIIIVNKLKEKNLTPKAYNSFL